MLLDGAADGAWIGGCAGAATVSGASSSAEYSRTSRPWPQSTSSRNVSSDALIGSALVTRITGLPCGSSATVNCSPLTVLSGGSRPTRAKVSGEASRACRFSSSPGSLEMIAISASSGSPRSDLTVICPSPSANAGIASAASTSASSSNHALCSVLVTPFPRFMAPTLAAAHVDPQRFNLRPPQFGDLDRVQRRTLADVVRDYPQVEPALVRQVLADAADENRVVARGVRDRRRIAAVGGLVDHFHARRGLKQFARPRRGELVAGLDVHRLGVAVEHRPPHHGGIHADRGVAEDLPGRVDQLHLLAGDAGGVEVARRGEQLGGAGWVDGGGYRWTQYD